jgi:Flp pilus assembly protein TadG
MFTFAHRGPRPIAPSRRREAERGQLLVVFALALVALIAMVGLIIDGGDTFLQKRDQQNVADAAAMAAGYAYVNGSDMTTAARTVAASNGYTHGSNSTTVDVVITSADVTVIVTRPHRNYFSGIVGFASWGVSATATVEAGTPNAATGAMPIIFNQKAFNNPNNKNKNVPAAFDEPGTGNQDVPQTDSTFNWTVFCTANGNPCNANSNDVKDLIDGGGKQGLVYLDDDIGPLNAGSHTTLFSSLSAHVGDAFPVAIVNDAGDLLGWAYFHITGSVGGSTKQISGYFDDQISKPAFTIVGGHGTAGNFGDYVVHLTN